MDRGQQSVVVATPDRRVEEEVAGFFKARQRLQVGDAALGLAQFYAVCGVGAVANVGIASWMFNMNEAWWLAALAGVVMGSVWNYTMSSLFVWRGAE